MRWVEEKEERSKSGESGNQTSWRRNGRRFDSWNYESSFILKGGMMCVG